LLKTVKSKYLTGKGFMRTSCWEQAAAALNSVKVLLLLQHGVTLDVVRCWTLVSLVDNNVERTSWNVLVSPLHHKNVVAALTRSVSDRVVGVSNVAHSDLVAWNSWSHHSNQQHVMTCARSTLTCKQLTQNIRHASYITQLPLRSA